MKRLQVCMPNGAVTVQTEMPSDVRGLIATNCLKVRGDFDGLLIDILELSMFIEDSILPEENKVLLRKSFDEMTRATHDFLRFNLKFLDTTKDSDDEELD